jgi:hypothetical protein
MATMGTVSSSRSRIFALSTASQLGSLLHCEIVVQIVVQIVSRVDVNSFETGFWES